MGELKITGDDRQLKAIAKTISGRVSKYGLKVVLDEKREGVSSPNPTGENKPPTAEEVAEIIKQCTSLDEMEQYKDDNRQIVSRVYKAKLKEITNDTDK